MGNFPSTSYVCREVGGSFYNIRKILQELENNSKLLPSKMESESSFEEELGKEIEAASKPDENSSSQIKVAVEIRKDGPTVAGMGTSDSGSVHFEANEGSHTSTSVDNILSKQVTLHFQQYEIHSCHLFCLLLFGLNLF